MYTYKLYLFVIYLLTFRWFFYFTGSEATAQKRNVTLDLSNLKEHGSPEESNPTPKLKETTFRTPEDKVVDKVVYDGTDVWVSSTEGSKVLKRVVLTHRNNIPQLLQLVVSSAGESAQEESVHYKKEKDRFTKFEQSEYTSSRTTLTKNARHYVNKWYPMDFARSELYSGSTRQQRDLEDGVWKTTYTPLSGTAMSVVKNGSTTMWTHAGSSKNVSSLESLEFGNHNFLLTISIGSDKKYFHKSGASATWQSLDSESAFLTTATNFKTNYFAENIDYDVSRPPNQTHFYVKTVQRAGNYNHLTLNVQRDYYLGNVKYKGKSLWTGEKDTRVLFLKLELLYHEVQILQVFYSLANTGPFPKKSVAYFYKKTNGDFERVSSREEFSKHQNRVKSQINESTTFVYSETWPSQPKPMDVNNFYAGDFDVQEQDLNNGIIQKTLTPKDFAPLNGVNFRGDVLWPTVRPVVTSPSVKQVVIISKNTLPQFVHVKATGVQVIPKPADGETNTPIYDVYYKKEGEKFTKLPGVADFDRLKSNLVSGTRNHDPFVHLDLNLETLNPDLYKVTTNYDGGVTLKVVEPKDNIRVTKLFSYSHELWVRSLRQVDHVLRKYELYSHGNKKLLKLFIGAYDDPHRRTHEYFEKRDYNLAWDRFFWTDFDKKLASLKSTATLNPLELDVSVSPSTTNYTVQVNSLSGNKTKLVLEPAEGNKITKVQHGAHVFFTSVDNNRAYKVELYLEDYSVRFVKVFVWKDAPHGSPLLTEEKHFKDVTASATTWATANFDAKLREFETTTSTVPFTYSQTWVLPPMTFDPKTSHRFYFPSTDQTEGLVTTTTYTPKLGTVVHKVLYDGSKVWPDTTDSAGDTTKKLVHLKVVSKNDMVQLLHLRNVLVANSDTTEDLYYKKVMDTYEKLENEGKFNELKGTLSKEDTYVDQNVKLDLSSTEETSTKLFEKETTLEDGVEKTVVVVKAGKLFQVSASPPLWTSRDGEYVTRLERYVLDLTQFLVLHITKPTGEKETKYFEKPIQTTPTPPEPGREPSGADSGRQGQTQPQSQDQHVEQQQQESQVQVPGPPAAPTTPSFSALDGRSAFFIKLNQAKASVPHQNVPLDVSAYTGNEQFEVKEATEGTAKLYKVYPKKAYWVTSLVNGSNNNLWTNPQQGERLVEAFLYVHDTKLKFVKAVVWPNNRTEASQDKLFHFKLEGERLVEKTAEDFKTELEALTKVPPTPLSTEKYPPPEPTPYSFYKLYLSDRVDTDIFEFTETNAGAYKLKKYAVKQHKFVNAVETQHGLLWKSDDNLDHMKSTQFAVKENSALARLTLSVNSQPTDLYFKFENDRWDALDTNTYLDLYAKAGVPSS